MKRQTAILSVMVLGVSMRWVGTSLAQMQSTQLPPLPPGTAYYSLAHELAKEPWPPFPFVPFPDLKLIQVDKSTYFFNDLDVDWDKINAEAAAQQAEEAALQMLLGGGSSYALMSFADYGTNLWLEMTAVTNELAFVTLHNTQTNQPYALLTKSDLNWSTWTPELFVIGSATNETMAQLQTLERTNLFVWARTCVSSNLSVDSNVTTQQLAQLIVGACVSISNVTYAGPATARGSFSNGVCAGLQIDTGILLSTGEITDAYGPNSIHNMGTEFDDEGDADLDAFSGGYGTTNAAVLEFDIVASNSFVLQFQFQYASEEYPEYAGGYNDPMAIYVTTNRVGTNWVITTTNNIALVPGTTNTPVSANTINADAYSQFYVDNGDPDWSTIEPTINMEYDGVTVLLTARAYISAGTINHIKIAIADSRDAKYDSAIFIKAASQCP